jgi:hypothetical protein
VAILLIKRKIKEIDENLHYVHCIVDVIITLSRKGIVLGNHRENFESDDVFNLGNFLKVLELISKYEPIVQKRPHEGPKNSRYTHCSIQNEIFGQHRDWLLTLSYIKLSRYFSVIADEARDISGKEQ